MHYRKKLYLLVLVQEGLIINIIEGFSCWSNQAVWKQMMKNRRMLAVKERDLQFLCWPPSATFLSDKALLSNTLNQSDLFSSFANFTLFDKNHNGSSAPDNLYGNPYDLSGRFNPSMGILIVVLLTAFFSMGFFSMYFRRCAGEEDGGGNSRMGGGGGNGRMYRASQGLDKSVIETFPMFNYSLIKRLKQGKHALECAVCLSEFEDDETLRLLPECGHAFHPDCIDMWLFSHTTCPLCRSSLLPEQGMRDNVEGQPQQGPLHTSEQVVIVVGAPNEMQDRVDHQDGGRSEMNPFDGGLLRTSPGQALGQARVHNEQRSSATDPPILGLINGVGPLEHESQSFKRSHSTGHSLVRLGENSGHPYEFYISTDDQYDFGIAEGLTESSKFGLHRSSSCASFCQPGSGSLGFFCSEVFANDGERLWRYPSSTETAGLEEASQQLDPHSSRGAAIGTDHEFATPKETRFDPRINSDRWHSPIFLRTFSDSRASYFQQQEITSASSTSRDSIPQGRKAYL